MFNAYLEQIGAMEGPDVEDLVVQALGAVDMLDGVIALQKVGGGGGREGGREGGRGGPGGAGAGGRGHAGQRHRPAEDVCGGGGMGEEEGEGEGEGELTAAGVCE